MNDSSSTVDVAGIPATLSSPGAFTFWGAVVLTGVLAGGAAALLMNLLYWVQHRAWPGPHLLEAAATLPPAHHLWILAAAGVLTGVGQVLLRHLTSGNSIDLTEAISRFAGRLPAARTLGTAVLSIGVVGLGASLGREGAPKQWGAVIANLFADRGALSDEQRRLLVACGAGAGLSAAYGVPLGGALFAVEVLRGVLALRLILPALLASGIAAGIAWLTLPNEPTYLIPSYTLSAAIVGWALLAGPILGLAAVLFIRLIAWADRHKPRGPMRIIAPLGALSLLGLASIPYPQLLGNGKDVAELAFTGGIGGSLLLALALLRPLATVMCVSAAVPGGLFTPSLSSGALLGAALGALGSGLFPGLPTGLCALVGAGALVAATTHGPLSSILLMFELTGRDRSFVLPLIIAVVLATVTARTLEPRSIYDARFSAPELEALLRRRRPAGV